MSDSNAQWAVIENGVVVAMTSADPSVVIPAGVTVQKATPGVVVGATWDGTAFANTPPATVANSSARRIMQQQFTTSGASFYSVVQSYLQKQVTDTATLSDNDPAKIGALGAWTQWDMGNFFNRTDPLVASMAQVITTAGGTVDLDSLFIAAGKL